MHQFTFSSAMLEGSLFSTLYLVFFNIICRLFNDGHSDGYDKKKNEIMPFPETWMDLKTVILSEVSQTEKQKRHMTSLISKI